MPTQFQPQGRACLIGSQPLSDHRRAIELIMAYTPKIPTWAQLPVYAHEGMVAQFAPGMPGLRQARERLFVDNAAEDFGQEMLSFFEAYLANAEGGDFSEKSRFALTADRAPGFLALIDALERRPEQPLAVKGHVTGPITFGTGLKDQEGRSIFFDDALRDAAVKLIAQKAAWQVRNLNRFGAPVIVFIDEPALAGYGSSELITISKEDISAALGEVIQALHAQGALAGVHVCANTDWSLLLNSSLDIINFDAHGYFDQFMLYREQIKRFFDTGRILAWGLIPTSHPEAIQAATIDGLWRDWQSKSERLAVLGIEAKTLVSQSMITPSCGMGSLTPELSLKVLTLTRELSERIRRS
jgi:methionine synthase II (cobalamin-independent)